MKKILLLLTLIPGSLFCADSGPGAGAGVLTEAQEEEQRLQRIAGEFPALSFHSLKNMYHLQVMRLCYGNFDGIAPTPKKEKIEDYQELLRHINNEFERRRKLTTSDLERQKTTTSLSELTVGTLQEILEEDTRFYNDLTTTMEPENVWQRKTEASSIKTFLELVKKTIKIKNGENPAAADEKSAH